MTYKYNIQQIGEALINKYFWEENSFNANSTHNYFKTQSPSA